MNCLFEALCSVGLKLKLVRDAVSKKNSLRSIDKPVSKIGLNRNCLFGLRAIETFVCDTLGWFERVSVKAMSRLKSSLRFAPIKKIDRLR